MATINDLSDVILCEILSYIDLVDRQCLERVCKRWQTHIRVLSSKISKISFEIRYEDGPILPWVRKNVPNGLEIMVEDPSGIGRILRICQNNLTELIINNEGPDGGDTDEFEPLRNCKNLKRFSIDTYDNNLIRDFLNYMPTESLEKFEVFNVEYEFTENIDDIIAEIVMEAEQLISLGLSGVSLKVLEIITEKSRLKCLDLGNHNDSIETEDLSLDFTNLINLEELEICEERMVNDQLVIQIAENCKKLRRVKLWSENSISAGLEALEKLPNLRSVNLYVPKEIGVLNYFSNLEQFQCDLRHRDSINEKSLTEFLKRSPNLIKYYFDHHPYHELFNEIAKKLGKEIKCTRY